MLLYRGLARDGVMDHAPGWGALLARIAFANVAMWAALSWLGRPIAWWLEATLSGRVAWLAASVAAGVGIYFLVLFVLGLRPSQLQLKR